MLKRLFARLFQSTPAAAQAPEVKDPATRTENFLRRDPILNREQAIIGYGFSIQHPEGGRDWSTTSLHFFDTVLLDRLARADLNALAGRRPAYLPLDPESLARPDLAALAKLGTVIKLQPGRNAAMASPQASARIHELAGQGLGFMLPASGLDELSHSATGVHLQVDRLAPPDIMARVRELRARLPGKPLLATGVDSVELFDACKQLGFDMFEGRHLTQRATDRAPNLNSQRLVVTQVISHLRRKESDFDKLALLARQDLALTLRLLRYINSAAMGLRHKVGSLEQAMTYIGRDGLYRWLTLLLFYDSRQSQVDAALRETALARGRFCELLARKRLSKAECEQAFVTGLLSLVDVLFSMPMDEALGHLGLPDEIHAALARQEGKYGAYVGLALAYERGDPQAITELAQRLALPPSDVDDLHMQALTWALDYGAGLESE